MTKNRIVADEEAFERLVDLFKQAHGRTPASDCEAYQWGAKMEDAALTAMGVAPQVLSVTSHGDADLLVKTGRGVAESRNRRVEILVR